MIRKLILTSIAFIFAVATFLAVPAIAADNSYQDALAQYEQQDQQSGQKQYDQKDQRTQEDQSYQKQSQSSQSEQQQPNNQQ